MSDGKIAIEFPQMSPLAALVDGRLGGTETAHEGNHRPSSSIDTDVDSR